MGACEQHRLTADTSAQNVRREVPAQLAPSLSALQGCQEPIGSRAREQDVPSVGSQLSRADILISPIRRILNHETPSANTLLPPDVGQ